MTLIFAQTETTTAAESASDTALLWLLIFGGSALLVFAIIYAVQRLLRRGSFNITFARLYGLLAVAILAVGLAFAELGGESKTAAFTLLGTIAGYLAGAKPTETSVGLPPAAADQGADGGSRTRGAPGASDGVQSETVL